VAVVVLVVLDSVVADASVAVIPAELVAVAPPTLLADVLPVGEVLAAEV
jgi:hypothetical protein